MGGRGTTINDIAAALAVGLGLKVPANSESVGPSRSRLYDAVCDAPSGAGLFDASKIDHRCFERDPRLRRVKRFVDEHYADPLPLGRVASVAGLERSYFSRYFHSKSGVCYRDWLNWLRVNRAIDLMNARDLSITEIAFAVGFRDLRTFERAVDRCTGQCPRVLKKKVERYS